MKLLLHVFSQYYQKIIFDSYAPEQFHLSFFMLMTSFVQINQQQPIGEHPTIWFSAVHNNF